MATPTCPLCSAPFCHSQPPSLATPPFSDPPPTGYAPFRWSCPLAPPTCPPPPSPAPFLRQFPTALAGPAPFPPAPPPLSSRPEGPSRWSPFQPRPLSPATSHSSRPPRAAQCGACARRFRSRPRPPLSARAGPYLARAGARARPPTSRFRPRPRRDPSPGSGSTGNESAAGGPTQGGGGGPTAAAAEPDGSQARDRPPRSDPPPPLPELCPSPLAPPPPARGPVARPGREAGGAGPGGGRRGRGRGRGRGRDDADSVPARPADLRGLRHQALELPALPAAAPGPHRDPVPDGAL
nr:CTD nuclear envelope phosphatase 1 isoform X1 [Caretta caretta]